MAEGGARPLLPQTAQMQSFSFAPPTLAPRENQRNYVFVDEHNRHKRLKVMRACEGCRKRKIKCDAATTNSWPCAACIRLKLNCIPPTMSYDKDFATGSHTFELTQPHEYHPSSVVTSAEDYQRHFAMQSQMAPEMAHSLPAPGSYPEGVRMYPAPHYIDQPSQEALAYAPVHSASVVSPDQAQYAPQAMYAAHPPQPTQTLPSSSESDSHWRNDSVGQLSEVLGELKIDHDAFAPYIVNQKKFLAEAPAVEEYEPIIPQHNSPNHALRVPPEMMPSEETALTYFDYFFKHIHHYVPVIDRKLFYEQWQNRRDAMSPLLLEAIFACATLMIGDTAQGNKWLAVASKHEESFKDVPRLSTIQAMLLILKARESAPKRGYFYRSWVTVESLISMAKELDLHEHLETHQMGKPCDSSPAECMTKTRVWHTLFCIEVMIGAPQGRYKFGVQLDTVDFSIPRLSDDPDQQSWRQFMYFARVVKDIEYTSAMHVRLKKQKKDWMVDPEFVQHNQDYVAWLRELPQDLQVVYAADGSCPWIPSHYIANLHIYYNLGVVMHHRPQLHYYLHDINDPYWKQHMMICYTAAKNMCRLQEAILQQYGLQGLLYMQRGISFTIYAALTCTMLHLVAITSPDPDLNRDARDFFVRQMRIVEQVTPSWPMPEMHDQINALRTAFSADVSKPFELKPSFPFGSPQVPSTSSPLGSEDQYRPRGPGQSPSMEQPGQINYNTHPMTPPISAHDSDSKTDSPVVQSLVMMAAGQRQQPPASIHVQEPVQWNPKGIFEQWNTAFGTPPPSTSSQSSPPLRPPPGTTSFEVRTPQDSHPSSFPQVANVNVSPHSATVPNVQTQLPPPVSYAPAAPYVTPTMWQDVVANSFAEGVGKRRWDYSQGGMVGQEQMAKRVR